MGASINLHANQRSCDKINGLWKQAFNENFLIYTRSVIEGEIEYMKNDPEQSYLASFVHTVDDWNKAVSFFSEGRGQIQLDNDRVVDKNDRYAENLIDKIQWIADHQKSFKWIAGVNDMVQSLLYEPYVVDIMAAKKLCGYSPLMLSLMKGKDEEVLKLIKDSENINQVNQFGETALMIATEFSNRDSKRLEWLVNAGADVYIKNNFKKNVLDMAKENDNKTIISFYESVIEHGKLTYLIHVTDEQTNQLEF